MSPLLPAKGFLSAYIRDSNALQKMSTEEEDAEAPILFRDYSAGEDR